METIFEIIKFSVSGGFWKFIGVFLMSYLIVIIPYLIVKLTIKLIRDFKGIRTVEKVD